MSLHDLLRKSERFFKTDMVYIARGGFWLYTAQICTGFISFFIAIAFANIVSQSDFGTYKYILSLSGLVGAISLSGMSTSISRAIASGYEGEFLKGFKFNLKWEVLISITSFLGAIYYFINDNYSLTTGLIIIGIFIPFKDSFGLYTSILIGKKDFKKISIYSITKQGLAAVWMLATIIITKNPMLWVASFFFIHTLLNLIIFLRVFITTKPNDKTDNETHKLTKHISLINSISSFADQMDNVLIFHFLGPISLAIYNFSQAIPDFLGGFIKNIGALAFPKFVQGDKNTIKKTLFRKSAQIFLFGAFISFIYILMAPVFFRLFFPKYLDSIFYSQIYSLMLPFLATILPLTYIDSLLAIKTKYKMASLSIVVKLILMFLGVYYFGLLGLVIARVATRIFGLASVSYFTPRA